MFMVLRLSLIHILWVCCFVNYESKVFEYLKKGTQVYVCGDVYADVFQKDDGSHIPSVLSLIHILKTSQKPLNQPTMEPNKLIKDKNKLLMAIPVILGILFLYVFFGIGYPARRAMSIEPAEALHEE